MNIQTQICGILLLLIITALYFRQKKIDLKTRNAFLLAVAAALLSITLDATSIVMITWADGHYGLGVQLICKAYLLSLVGVGYASFSYITADLMISHILKRSSEIEAVVLAGVSAVLIFVMPIHFYVTENELYTYGPSVMVTYIFAVGYVIVNFLMLVYYKKNMNPKRWKAGLTWMCIWIVASVLQFLNNNWLLVGYASALGVTILFINLENPEKYLDRVTGHFNEQALQQYVLQRYMTDTKFSMLVIKLDNIHYFNEMFGKNHIDLLQKYMGNYLAEQRGAMVFKHVEWEYFMIFDRDEDRIQALQTIEQRFEQDWVVDGVSVRLSPRIVELPDSRIAVDVDELMETLHLFIVEREQESLRSTVCLDERWIVQKKQTEEVEKTILYALKNDLLQVFFQPIYSTSKKMYVSAEALVRIVQEDGTVIPPSTFIPVAERNGLIIQVGKMVFEKTCRFLMEEKLWEKGIEYLEINLSAIQCVQEDLAAELIQIMERYQVEPRMINLEITESAAVQSKEILLENMRKLQEYGVSFSLDDFGTGYSNLDYVLELPVQIVKFDREMTVSYFESERGRLVMEAAIGMVQAVELKIVSEGVETREQLDMLEQLHIDYIQGYYFSRPVCGPEFMQLLTKSQEN